MLRQPLVQSLFGVGDGRIRLGRAVRGTPEGLYGGLKIHAHALVFFHGAQHVIDGPVEPHTTKTAALSDALPNDCTP